MSVQIGSSTFVAVMLHGLCFPIVRGIVCVLRCKEMWCNAARLTFMSSQGLRPQSHLLPLALAPRIEKIEPFIASNATVAATRPFKDPQLVRSIHHDLADFSRSHPELRTVHLTEAVQAFDAVVKLIEGIEQFVQDPRLVTWKCNIVEDASCRLNSRRNNSDKLHFIQVESWSGAPKCGQTPGHDKWNDSCCSRFSLC